ncbi:acyl-CoA dehydrogenase family protein [Pelomonas sp. KK5]|uniref:acyl-CoA dehydrogenase family protein n=1 Tax=Pelomonas sp. KK5 TaxID=1855730 RepID=UPI00097BD28A|nr:acyl-CoA dehydrogenase family protein [Pelomonas sp. KK5]
MHFALTDDQLMIRNAAEAFLSEACDSAAVRRAAGRMDRALWQRIAAELGWCATAIPEDCGGLGLGQVELVLLAEQMGRRLPCVPFLSTVGLAATALMEAGGGERWLAQIAAGELSATLALGAREVSLAGCAIWARREGESWLLDGGSEHVPDGADAALLLVVARTDDGPGLFALANDHPGLTRTPLETWDLTRRLARIELAGVPAQRIGEVRAIDFERIEALAALMLAAEQLGGAQQCLDLTLAYCSERSQFGQPIAGFQAVKHRCAEMMVKVETTRSAVYGAAAVADTKPPTRELVMEIGAAKALASEAFFFCAQEAIQLHGGVGFTWEYDPQLYFKRAQAGSRWLGTPESWRERIAAELME